MTSFSNNSFLLLFILVLSCNSDGNIRTYKLEKPKILNSNVFQNNTNQKNKQLFWDYPKGWLEKEASGMRIASFQVPYSNGFGDLSIISLIGDGGGLESNINRWRKQLDLEPQTINIINHSLLVFEGKVGPYTFIEIKNDMIDKGFLCAILPLNDKTLFIKLSLTSTGLLEVKQDFLSFCNSINFTTNQ